jgi:hypothetical protein
MEKESEEQCKGGEERGKRGEERGDLCTISIDT